MCGCILFKWVFRAIKMSADSRFDDFDHWLIYDDNNSRSICKMPGCVMLTHAFCTKCKIHLCFKKERNCFRKYHFPTDQTTYVNSRSLNNAPPGKVAATKRAFQRGRREMTQVEGIPINQNRRMRRDVSNNSGEAQNDPNSLKKVVATKTTQNKNRRVKKQSSKIMLFPNTRLLRNRVINLDHAASSRGSVKSDNCRAISTTLPSIESQLIQNNDNELEAQFFSYLQLYSNKTT